MRPGKGKYRNRRHVQKKGPLIIYAKNNGIARAFRNIPGVDLMNVSRLNLLGLAPGGHVGRFIIWTESAFKELQNIFGSYTNPGDSKLNKRGGVKYTLPRPMMTNTDVESIINTESIQSVIRPYIVKSKKSNKKEKSFKKFLCNG